MHWTALLEKRQFPAHARIIDDLGCIGCGYNLRGATVGGNCPECGMAVHASLFELAHPDIVASGFRAVSRSYLVHYVLLITALAPTFGGMDMFLLAGVALLIACCYRVWGLGTLRFRGAIERLPVVGTRLQVMFILGALEWILLAGCCALWYAFARNPPLTPGVADQWKMIMGGAWFGASLLGLVVNGWGASALAAMLEYDTCRRELIIQQVLLLTSPLVAILLMISGLFLVMASGYQIGSGVIYITGGISLALIWGVAIGYTSVALLRLAGAAEQEQDTMEDIIDTPRSELPHHAPPAREQEKPDIELE